MDNRFALKIKLKSLMAEARIIKDAENRLRPVMVCAGLDNYKKPFFRRPNDDETPPERRLERRRRRALLRQHRIAVVRPAARATVLAYTFLRGKEYRQVEAKTHYLSPGTVKDVERMVERYGIQQPEAPVSDGAVWEAYILAKAEQDKRLKAWFTAVPDPATA